jgi:dienelactone hydrolase
MNRLIFAVSLLVVFAPQAIAAGLVEEAVTLPASFPRLLGTSTLALDALVIRPDDDQRHPLAVINHGTPRDPNDRQRMSPRDMRGQAREFARRGWVAVTFTRRGYGASEGTYAESAGSCNIANAESAGRASAQDVREVIRLMTEKSYVDGARVISVGRSAGGFATVALAAEPPPGLIAAINFAGGRGSMRPDEVCNVPGLVDAFATFGRTSRVPMLWVYADNDHYFGPALARRFFEAFTAAGGQAEFVAAAAFGDDGHHLFSRAGAPIWTGYVDRFLEKHDLKLVDQLLPIDDGVAFPGGLGERGKAGFLDFLDARQHKAFAMSANGHFGWRSGRDSTAEAVEQAAAFCNKLAGQPCHAVMIDDQIGGQEE